MSRIAFIFCTIEFGLSVLLALHIFVLPNSFFQYNTVSTGTTTIRGLMLHNGSIELAKGPANRERILQSLEHGDSMWDYEWGFGSYSGLQAKGGWRARFFGFSYEEFAGEPNAASTQVFRIPLWPFVIILLFLSSWFLYRQWIPIKRISYRLNHGLCIRCGYDLRGTTGRCPECGNICSNEARQHLAKLENAARM